ncbi:cadherin-related family member 5-like isoform X1 [Misgurnus anguillicaudatus]|uniref:cadherin-related family member 5-like isoform X1 n=1 Tax=Misgurnus anguillicaudatus TaxID=75329 RepID=UPI003CCF21D5
MDLRHKSFALFFGLLMVLTLSKFSEGQSLCSVNDQFILFKENNTLNAVVTTLTTEADVSVSITNEKPPGLFELNGLDLIAITVLDYETFNTPYEVDIECTKDGSSPAKLNLRIILENINDNPPVFDESEYAINVAELLKVDTSVARITATDADEGDQLYYRLDAPEGEFDLEASFNPNILVKKRLDYEKVKQITMTLFVQDTPISSTETVSHTSSTTIKVNIVDVDNRPPWFQPCTTIENDNSIMCINTGYTGTVNSTGLATGPLPLEPGPILAIDGDAGINEAIGYKFLADNPTFEINSDTGSITMVKPVNQEGPIVLSVMAYQKQNTDQYATNTVTFTVRMTTNHPPKFLDPSYEGFISEDAGVNSLVMESKTSNKPLRVQATDDDFVNGVNPNIAFEVIDGSDFYITLEGFILLAKEIPFGTLNLQMRVVDKTNGESDTASLTIEVTPGIPTTTAVTTITTTDQTTITDQTTVKITDQTTVKTTDQITDSTTTSDPDAHTSPITGDQQLRFGGYKAEDMAALGGSLAVVIILCLVGIGLLAYRVKSHNSNWKKISEVSVFRSNLGGGSGGPKEGVQYVNESFRHDDDTESVKSGLAADLEKKLESGVRSAEEQKISTASVPQKTSNIRAASDSSSLASADIEKEVKPILTKERRAEDGYKAVWFKQDIDPNTKEDVVIIPDTGEPVDHDDDDDDDDDEDDEGNLKTDKEPARRYSKDSDSENEERLTSDL